MRRWVILGVGLGVSMATSSPQSILKARIEGELMQTHTTTTCGVSPAHPDASFVCTAVHPDRVSRVEYLMAETPEAKAALLEEAPTSTVVYDNDAIRTQVYDCKGALALAKILATKTRPPNEVLGETGWTVTGENDTWHIEAAPLTGSLEVLPGPVTDEPAECIRAVAWGDKQIRVRLADANAASKLLTRVTRDP